MRVLMHVLIRVPGASSFGVASQAAAKLVKGTSKLVIDAVSIEEATVVHPDIIKRVQDAVANETGIIVRSDQAKRIATTLDFGGEMDETDFYRVYPDEEDLL